MDSEPEVVLPPLHAPEAKHVVAFKDVQLKTAEEFPEIVIGPLELFALMSANGQVWIDSGAVSPQLFKSEQLEHKPSWLHCQFGMQEAVHCCN